MITTRNGHRRATGLRGAARAGRPRCFRRAGADGPSRADGRSRRAEVRSELGSTGLGGLARTRSVLRADSRPRPSSLSVWPGPSSSVPVTGSTKRTTRASCSSRSTMTCTATAAGHSPASSSNTASHLTTATRDELGAPVRPGEPLSVPGPEPQAQAGDQGGRERIVLRGRIGYPAKCGHEHLWSPGHVIVFYLPCPCRADEGISEHTVVRCTTDGCRSAWYRPQHYPPSAAPSRDTGVPGP